MSIAWCSNHQLFPYVPTSLSQQGQGVFIFSKISRPALGSTQPPIQSVPGTVPTGKQSGLHVDHLPSYSTEVKNEWIYSSTPPPYPPATPWCGEGQIFYFYTNKKSGININQIPRLMADFCIRHSYNKFGSEIFRWTNSSPPSQLCVCLILYISCPALRY